VQDYYYNNYTPYNTADRIEMKLKVHHPDGKVIADVYDYAAGALLMSLYGDGSHISYRGRALWREGIDGEGAESYDTTSMAIEQKLIDMGVRLDG
jgi:hypothetical protein